MSSIRPVTVDMVEEKHRYNRSDQNSWDIHGFFSRCLIK